MVVLKQPHLRALGPVGLREDFDFKRLSFLEVARQRQLLHRDIAAARDAEWNDVNAHTQRSGRDHRGKRIAYVLVAIGQQHQSLLAGFRKRRRAQANRRRDVGSFAADDRLNFLVADFCIRRRVDRCVRPENEHPRLVNRLLFRRCLDDILPRSLLLFGRNAVRAVEQEINVHPFLRPLPLQPGDGQHQRQHNHHAQAERSPPPPGADLHVRPQRQPDRPRRRHEQQR